MRNSLLAIVVFLMSTISLMGQSQSGGATLQGRISDATGNVLAQAKISVTEKSTGFTRKTVTGADGQFLIVALPVGVYRLEAAAAGFSTSVAENLELVVGKTQTVNFTMQVASLATSVNV
ncbi:MAG TPA: carboxypeptidase-like regulatory domain-containing protein, partial [Candidatus Solibacter sp.]|nr:carboxypeptidase-like regulatory domain-containing protein [Candidatus Solibacter sp.]